MFLLAAQIRLSFESRGQMLFNPVLHSSNGHPTSTHPCSPSPISHVVLLSYVLSKNRHHRLSSSLVDRARVSDQVASQLLLSLDGFEERLEVTSTKAVEVVTLDDFDEDSRAVQQML